MNPTGIGIASVLGLLAVWLYLGHSEQIASEQREQQTDMRCQKAEFDLSFARKWNEPAEKLQQLADRVKATCSEFELEKTKSAAQGEVVKAEQGEVKKTIDAMMR